MPYIVKIQFIKLGIWKSGEQISAQFVTNFGESPTYSAEKCIFSLTIGNKEQPTI